MNSPNLLHERASELAEAARTFQTAAGQSGSHAGAPGSLEALEEALQVLSAAWYQLAADASPGLMGTLHEVGAAFARCARACRLGRSRLDRSRGAEVSWLDVPDPPTKSAA
jgi:hypothetical protein